MKTIHLIAAARPNFMKVAPLYHELHKADWAEAVIVHTGQHNDLNMSEAFFKDLMLPVPPHHLGVGSGSHAKQTGKLMIAYEIWGPAVAEDFFHRFSGWLIFVFGLAVLLSEIWVLKKIFPDEKFSSVHGEPGLNAEGSKLTAVVTPEPLNLKPAAFGWKTLLHPPQFVVAVELLAATLAAAQGIEFREKIPPSKSFAEFPEQVAEWSGRREVMDAKFIKELDLNDYVIVDFVNGGQAINFYSAYYEASAKANRSTPRRPACRAADGSSRRPARWRCR